jgi:F-type H+-transporting ATPase subunit gamma
MPNIKEIVSRIASVSSTQQITKAMKMVSASKLNKTQCQLENLNPYAKELVSIAENVILHAGENEVLNHYTMQRPIEKMLLIILGSDKGLCGAFNTNVIKKAISYLNDSNSPCSDLISDQIDILALGKKISNFFQKMPYKLLLGYESMINSLTFQPVGQLADYLIHSFITLQYDQVVLIYNHFINAANQVVVIEPFLPFLPKTMQETVCSNYIYEPSTTSLIDTLIPMTLRVQLFKSLLESNVSEHGARVTTMSKATDNAEELLKSLRITYNKTRQASITNEILEISAGAEALAN